LAPTAKVDDLLVPKLRLPSTPELQHDLQKIHCLLTVLISLPVENANDLNDVICLHNRHRFLRSVIASRADWPRPLVQRARIDLCQFDMVTSL
jgi:hypothetical protein